MHKTFKLNVQAVVNNGDKTLLLKRGGKWTMPGGRYEDTDRTIEEALRREIREETGVNELTVGELLHVTTGEKTILVFFVAETSATEVTLSHEHDDFRWFETSELTDVDYEYDSLADIISKARKD